MKVKNNLSEDKINEFLRTNKNYFYNTGYKLYFTNVKFVHKNANRTVQPNELMIAIKEEY